MTGREEARSPGSRAGACLWDRDGNSLPQGQGSKENIETYGSGRIFRRARNHISIHASKMKGQTPAATIGRRRTQLRRWFTRPRRLVSRRQAIYAGKKTQLASCGLGKIPLRRVRAGKSGLQQETF